MASKTDTSVASDGQEIVVITGASRGLGWAVADALASPKRHLVVIARTTGGLEDLDDLIKSKNGSATLVPLDLTDFDAIDRIGAVLYERFGKVDGLVGAAAQLGVLSPVGHIKPRVWSKTFDLNVTANWRLIRSLDPLLRQAPSGRAVFVTDRFATRNEAYWSVYAASKAALEQLVLSYAAEITQSRMAVNLFDPGPMATALRGQAYPGEDRSKLAAPTRPAADLIKLLRPDWHQSGQIVRFAG